MFEALRKAGAAAREMLTQAAAQAWKVPADQCEARDGKIRNTRDDRTLTYGELCVAASDLPVPQNPSLKSPERFRIIGTAMPRLDVPDKVSGAAVFGADFQVPNMLFAAIERRPTYGSKLLFFDREGALRIPGVRRVVSMQGCVAVCAETMHAAWKGRDALNPKWDRGTYPSLDNRSLEATLLDHLQKKPAVARNDGDVQRALFAGPKRVEATYVLPYLAHATMEPMNCSAHVQHDRCDVWIPTQNQTGVLQAAAKITALKPEKIHVHTTFIGGGFGRRFEVEVAEEAVSLSKELQRPVKVLWDREEDMKHDVYRPGNACTIQGAIDQMGRVTAWWHTIAAPSVFSRILPQFVKDGIDPSAVEGVAEMEYEIPNVKVEYVKVDTPVPVGFWRSVGHSHNAFTVESFVDELAHAANRDPLEFRLGLLKNHARAGRVLKTAAENAGWGRPLPPGMGRGIAQHTSFGSYIAQVAEVGVDEEKGAVRVSRIVCAVDCGPVINPSIVTAQMESGILMGLSAALKERVMFKGGGVASGNYDDYEILRLDEIPEIEVHIVKSSSPLGGIGEPGLPPAAPAVANALFAATGVRVRRLPLSPDHFLGAARRSKA
jgi:isoquinoline 1-oxidoreductase beta subunit